MCFSMLLDLVSVSVLFSPFMCLDDIKLSLGSGVAPFWERVAHSVSIRSVCIVYKSNRKAMNRNWSNQKSNPALKTKAGNK